MGKKPSPSPPLSDEQAIAQAFGISVADFKVLAGGDPSYNCIAYAAGDSTDWWQPIIPPQLLVGPNAPLPYWPSGAPRNRTLNAYEKAYSTVGYSRFTKAKVKLPADAEYVALFADASGNVLHAAYLPLGGTKWHSKCGPGPLIEHDLAKLEGAKYGTVQRFLRREPKDKKPKPAPAPVT